MSRPTYTGVGVGVTGVEDRARLSWRTKGEKPYMAVDPGSWRDVAGEDVGEVGGSCSDIGDGKVSKVGREHKYASSI